MKAQILVEAAGNKWSEVAQKLKTRKEVKEILLTEGKYSLVAKYEGEETSLKTIKEILKECDVKGDVVVLHASIKKGKYRFFEI
ncbi:MAG: hypothetical protein ACPLXS_02330 [Candidatus Micrarchaeales archaeon]